MGAKKNLASTYPHHWDVSISELPEIGKSRERRLNQMGIYTVKDLLLYPPRRYEDRRNICTINSIRNGNKYTLLVTVEKARRIFLSKGIQQARVMFKDDTGNLEAIFWGRGYLINYVFQTGKKFFLYGSIEKFNSRFVMNNPEYEEYVPEEESIHTSRLVPIYTVTEGISLRSFRRWIYEVLTQILIDDTLSEEFINARGFMTLQDAIRKLHFPDSIEEIEQARQRLAYDEVLKLQKEWLTWRTTNLASEHICRHRINGSLLKTFQKSLPFSLTNAQKRVIDEVLHDMSSNKQMLRLIQGDVGCGKTLVAIHALLSAVDSGYQTVLMAPTEILAEQHYLNIQHFLNVLPVQVALLTGSVRNAKEIRQKIANGKVNIVIGTHALIQDTTQFQNLGLVVIDEQHRFGVMQRKKLRMKGQAPDILYLTATPIPRTLALTVYGGMDISIIDELPSGRKPVKTHIVREEKREDLLNFIIKQAQNGFATYWVCPSIEESTHKENLKPLFNIYETLRNGAFSTLRTDLLHGRLSFNEKAEVMNRLGKGEIDVLFCTTVIEVGVDIPHATTLVIENADCFGLAQLHQLRGRVGRSSYDSFCFLVPTSLNSAGIERLKILCQTNNGFEIAEQDLLLRGHGELGGLRQAGMSDLKFIDFSHDLQIIQQARNDAQILVCKR